MAVQINEFERYYLGDGDYYFKYRKDKNNPNLQRATLYNRFGLRVDDINTDDRTHHQVINYFEVKVMTI